MVILCFFRLQGYVTNGTYGTNRTYVTLTPFKGLEIDAERDPDETVL